MKFVLPPLHCALVAGVLWTATASAQTSQHDDSGNARALFDRAMVAYDAGRLDEALELFLSAHDVEPSPELRYNLGRVYERMGDAKQAIHFFESYVREAKPRGSERRLLLRRIKTLRKVVRQQRDETLKAPPTSGELAAEARQFFVRGVKLFDRGRYEAALVAFQAAQGFVKLPEVAYNLGLTSERLGRAKEAVAHYRQYLRADKSAPDRAHVEQRIEKLRAR